LVRRRAEEDADFELGMMLGGRKASVSVAGPCHAGDAECLRSVRDQKLYVSRAATWEEFCPKFLGLSKTHTNRIIRNLEKFGPDYFEVVQLTLITPEQYRAIAPAIRGEALIPENSDRVTAAVAETSSVRRTRRAAGIDPGEDVGPWTPLRSIGRRI